MLSSELTKKRQYSATLRDQKLWLPEPKTNNTMSSEIRKQSLQKYWDDIEEVQYRLDLPHILEIIWSEFINRNHTDSLAEYFRMDQT